MGSTGWCQCDWCWKWKYNCYIPDGISARLCDDCVGRVCQGLGPPWHPNAMERCEQMVLMILSKIPELDGMEAMIAANITDFIADPMEP